MITSELVAKLMGNKINVKIITLGLLATGYALRFSSGATD
jgi:hypothetical protein